MRPCPETFKRVSIGSYCCLPFRCGITARVVAMLRINASLFSLMTSVAFLSACSERDDCGGRNNVRAGSFEISSSSPDQLSDLQCAQVITGDLRIRKGDSLSSLSELVHVMGDLDI